MTATWLGMRIGFSLIEAPLKSTAPGAGRLWLGGVIATAVLAGTATHAAPPAVPEPVARPVRTVRR